MWRKNPSKVSYSILNFCNHAELSRTMGWQSLLMSNAPDCIIHWAKIIVSRIPLQWSLFRNNSHSFSCEAVRLLWTSSAPVSITETPTKFFSPKILLFIESVVRTVWKELPMTVVGSQEGLTERVYPNPALRVQRYTKLIYPNFTQCESKFYVQISWQLRWMKR